MKLKNVLDRIAARLEQVIPKKAPLTMQDVFDRVSTHLQTQGVRASVDGSCCYQTAEGLKCAVGCLIKDKHYIRGIEGLRVSEAPVRTVLEKSLGPVLKHRRMISLLHDLQLVHDDVHTWDTPETLRRKLRAVALHFDLEFKSI